MRKKIPELTMACGGPITASHPQMCRLHLDAYDHLTGQLAELDQLAAQAAASFGRLIARLVTIPRAGQRTSGRCPCDKWLTYSAPGRAEHADLNGQRPDRDSTQRPRIRRLGLASPVTFRYGGVRLQPRI
jgi:hypothetical protein